MTAKENARCGHCGKRLKKGGDNYRLDCSVVSDFDGYLDATAVNRDPGELIAEIAQSGLNEDELTEQVYFELKQLLCFDCRNEIIDYLKRKE
jgi:hypothetical protein